MGMSSWILVIMNDDQWMRLCNNVRGNCVSFGGLLYLVLLGGSFLIAIPHI